MDKHAHDGVNAHVRVLLLDPRSYFAVERSLIEEGHAPTVTTFRYNDSDLCRNIS